MRLNPSAFNAFLSGNIGQDVLWRPNTMCPCVNPASGAANKKCPRCAGKGRLWSTGVPAKVGVQRQAINEKRAQAFNWEMGDAMLSVDESSPMYDAGQFDRITMLNSIDRFSLVLTRGAPTERLYMQVVSVDRVYWYTGPGGTGSLVDGGAPTIDPADGSLTWGVGAPPAGAQYSITGTRYSEYFVYLDLPSDRNEHFGARLPKRIICKRFEVFGR
jgi:hypothetical protein